jgi:hypothetical protein
MMLGATPLPPWAFALVTAALAPVIARTIVDALVRRARARSASALRDLELRLERGASAGANAEARQA